MKKYCTDCSKPMEYGVSPPNFCPNCGHKFSVFGHQETEPTKPVRVKKRPVEPQPTKDKDAFGIEEGGNSEITSIPDMTKLEFEVSVAKKQSLEQLMGGPASSTSEFGPRGEEPRTSEEDFLKRYSEEGGSNPRRNS